jgi:hypothetical protein
MSGYARKKLGSALADTRALYIAPENHALLRERVDALTDNRVNTPALLLSQKVALPPRSVVVLS